MCPRRQRAASAVVSSRLAEPSAVTWLVPRLAGVGGLQASMTFVPRDAVCVFCVVSPWDRVTLIQVKTGLKQDGVQDCCVRVLIGARSRRAIIISGALYSVLRVASVIQLWAMLQPAFCLSGKPPVKHLSPNVTLFVALRDVPTRQEPQTAGSLVPGRWPAFNARRQCALHMKPHHIVKRPQRTPFYSRQDRATTHSAGHVLTSIDSSKQVSPASNPTVVC